MGGWYKSGQFWPIYVSNEEMRKKCAAFYDHYNTLEQTYIMYTYKAACSNNISQSSYKKYTILQAWQYYSEEMAAKWSEIYKKLLNLGKRCAYFGQLLTQLFFLQFYWSSNITIQGWQGQNLRQICIVCWVLRSKNTIFQISSDIGACTYWM